MENKADCLSVVSLLRRRETRISAGWLVELRDFQRNLRFGSKLPERAEELRKKTGFLQKFSLFASNVINIENGKN